MEGWVINGFPVDRTNDYQAMALFQCGSFRVACTPGLPYLNTPGGPTWNCGFSKTGAVLCRTHRTKHRDRVAYSILSWVRYVSERKGFPDIGEALDLYLAQEDRRKDKR